MFLFCWLPFQISHKELYMSHTACCKSQVNCPALPNYTAGNRLHFAVLSIVCGSSLIRTRRAARLWQLLQSLLLFHLLLRPLLLCPLPIGSCLLFLGTVMSSQRFGQRMSPDPSPAVVIQIVGECIVQTVNSRQWLKRLMNSSSTNHVRGRSYLCSFSVICRSRFVTMALKVVSWFTARQCPPLFTLPLCCWCQYFLFDACLQGSSQSCAAALWAGG